MIVSEVVEIIGNRKLIITTYDDGSVVIVEEDV